MKRKSTPKNTRQKLSHVSQKSIASSWKLFGCALWVIFSLGALSYVAYQNEQNNKATETTSCLGKTKICGSDALGFEYKGHTYCYNTHEEFVKRCREAIPHKTSCHNEHCFYAGNWHNEDFPGNCHWGYFDYNDAQNWCKSKGGHTITASEMQELWNEFMKCNPSFGKFDEACYWTDTTACRMKNGGWNNARADGYINAGGVFCQIK